MKDLKTICNKWIPIKGFSAITVFGTIFRREEYCGSPISQTILNHETIHVLQSEDFIPNKKITNLFGLLIGWSFTYYIL